MLQTLNAKLYTLDVFCKRISRIHRRPIRPVSAILRPLALILTQTYNACHYEVALLHCNGRRVWARTTEIAICGHRSAVVADVPGPRATQLEPSQLSAALQQEVSNSC